MKKATLQLETLTCPSCMQKIEKGVNSLNGINKDTLKVSFNSSKVKVEFDDQITSINDIENTITKLGYEVLKSQVKDI
ncbi:heavy-metal-associated domain-containing protein [Mycoplasma sp. P36-A1]|uniref:heavy-metal-associated domain-containing protein n=1 Tax=Mycoplasma sp. P36-A1 TaxID=3252900 RepID=UPI003C2B2F3C